MIVSPFFMSAAGVTTVTTDTYGNPSSAGSGWTNYTVRIIIPTSHMSATAASTSVRVTFRGPVSEGLGIDAAYIGQYAGSGDAWDFDGNQVQMQVGSSNSFDIGVDSDVQTDACSISLSPSTAVIVGIDITSNTSKDNIIQVSDTDWDYHYAETDANTAGTTAPDMDGSGGGSTRFLIKALEWTSVS